MKRPPELANFFSEGKEISIEPSMGQGGARGILVNSFGLYKINITLKVFENFTGC